ncbi:MAG: hypothetical protein K6E98_07010 [Lachnospiraceae bacterium]|nr:hypothetical protein [Lachnospiraceae bacterium]
MLEVTSVGDKIYVCFLQVLKTEKYFNAFREVLKELGIPVVVEGPYLKRLPKHRLPS